MPGDVIAYDPQAVTFPAMNTVPYLLLLFLVGRDPVIPDQAILAVLKIDAKEIIEQVIADDADMPAVINFDATHIFHGGVT